MLGNYNGTDGQTDRQTDIQSATQYMRPPPREEGRVINDEERGGNCSSFLNVATGLFLYLSVLARCTRQTSNRQTSDVRQKHRLMPPSIRGGA